jgi:hypothetical protein
MIVDIWRRPSPALVFKRRQCARCSSTRRSRSPRSPSPPLLALPIACRFVSTKPTNKQQQQQQTTTNAHHRRMQACGHRPTMATVAWHSTTSFRVKALRSPPRRPLSKASWLLAHRTFFAITIIIIVVVAIIINM